MNAEQLGNIEERWLKASGGPWSTSDFRVHGMGFTTAAAMEALKSGKARKLETVFYATYESALAAGAVKDLKQWSDMLEKELFSSTTSEMTLGRCVQILCKPRKMIADENRKIDRAVFLDKDGPETTIASFAILDGAKPADIEFVLRAPDDIGTLITEVRKLHAKVDRLVTDLHEAVDATASALEREATAKKAVKSMLDAAKQIINTQGD